MTKLNGPNPVGRFLGVFLIAVLAVAGCGDGKKYHDENTPPGTPSNGALAEILQYQASLNASFRDPEVSPLPDRFRKNFEGLDFFPPDTAYLVRARLERTPEALPFDMPTSTAETTPERIYGILKFELEGKPYRLEVYQSPDLMMQEGYEDYLFLPFTDRTNGNETYEGGRYIDLRIPQGDAVTIDFNRAYNPYCAYNPSYSCPIVPSVNHLDREIRAGVKAFTKE